MNRRVARSYLYVPGNRPDRFDKACAAGADAVILDLEDAVPATEKAAARVAIAAWLSPARAVLVRVNAADTEWSTPILPRAMSQVSLAWYCRRLRRLVMQ